MAREDLEQLGSTSETRTAVKSFAAVGCRGDFLVAGAGITTDRCGSPEP